MEKAIEFLKTILMGLVDNPEDIKIESKTDEMGILLTLSVNKSDMGKVIGRNGNNAGAIRTLVRAVGMKESAMVNVRIAEPDGTIREAYKKPLGDSDFKL